MVWIITALRWDCTRTFISFYPLCKTQLNKIGVKPHKIAYQPLSWTQIRFRATHHHSMPFDNRSTDYNLCVQRCSISVIPPLDTNVNKLERLLVVSLQANNGDAYIRPPTTSHQPLHYDNPNSSRKTWVAAAPSSVSFVSLPLLRLFKDKSSSRQSVSAKELLQ